MADTALPGGYRVSAHAGELRCRLCGLMVQRTLYGTVDDGLNAHRYIVHGIPSPDGRTLW